MYWPPPSSTLPRRRHPLLHLGLRRLRHLSAYRHQRLPLPARQHRSASTRSSYHLSRSSNSAPNASLSAATNSFGYRAQRDPLSGTSVCFLFGFAVCSLFGFYVVLCCSASLLASRRDLLLHSRRRELAQLPTFRRIRDRLPCPSIPHRKTPILQPAQLQIKPRIRPQRVR